MKNKKIKNCPVCKNKKISINSKINSVIRDFTVFKCSECNLFFQNPIPTKKDQNEFFNDMYALKINMIQEKRAFLDFDQKQEQGRLGEIVKFKKKGKLLDVGASTGFFLEYLIKKEGWEGFGIEYSNKAANIAKKRGINMELGDLESTKYPSNSFDVITMHSVLEHIPNLEKAMGKCYSLLKKDGLLVFNVPNMNSFEYYLYRGLNKSFAGFNYDHIYYFSPKTVDVLLKNNNFKIIHITSRHYSTLRLPPKRPLIGLVTFPFKLFLEYTDMGGKFKKGNIIYVYAIKK